MLSPIRKDATLEDHKIANEGEIVEYLERSPIYENLSRYRTKRGRAWITAVKDIAAGEECFRRYGVGGWYSTVSLGMIPALTREYYELNFQKIVSDGSKEERYSLISK
jgi:hypothetical protein